MGEWDYVGLDFFDCLCYFMVVLWCYVFFGFSFICGFCWSVSNYGDWYNRDLCYVWWFISFYWIICFFGCFLCWYCLFVFDCFGYYVDRFICDLDNWFCYRWKLYWLYRYGFWFWNCDVGCKCVIVVLLLRDLNLVIGIRLIIFEIIIGCFLR